MSEFRRCKAFLTAFGLLLWCAGAQPQGAVTAAPTPASANIVRATLANGLRVVIVRNTLAPVVATAVNYLVGSDEAPAGFPGMAHAQEHMMFRGSPDLSADQLANIGSLMGGNFNANTRESVTQYLYTVPSEDVDLALHIEAARMRGVLDSEDGWDKERGAIEQEVAQDLSNPSYRLYEQMRAKMFAGSVYEHSALGTKPSFDKTTAAMLKQFYDTWYAPNNAILVIVGNLDPGRTLTKVRELFGDIPTKKLPPRTGLRLAPFPGGRVTLPTDRPSATQIVAFRLPGLDSPDFPALDILSDVLSSQRSELYGLVVQGRALGADFSLDPLPHAGLGYAAVSFAADGDAARMDDAIRAILAKVAANGVAADLVKAAIFQERRQAEFQKNSIAGLASAWSDALALYGLASPDSYLARLEKVTVADVNRVARKYLKPASAFSATLRPENSGNAVASSASFGGQEAIALEEAKDTHLPAWAEAGLSQLAVPPTTLHPAVSKLSNGITLIVLQTDVSDTISIFGHIRNRPEVAEAIGKEGAALVLEELLSFGTQKYDRVSFQKALDAIGAQERAGTDFSIKVLRPDFARAAELLAENEIEPALPQAALDSLKDQLGRYVAARNRSPSYLAQRSLRTGLYPPGDPMLRQADGQSIASLTRTDIVAYHRYAFRPDLATIAVAGNIAPQAAKAVIEKAFGRWQAAGPPPDIDLPLIPANKAVTLAVPDLSRVQDDVVLAQTLMLSRAHPDYDALQLGNAMLGGGFYASRLSIDLRKNAGLVYSVNSGLQAGRTRSAFLVRYASDPQNVAKAADAVMREIKDMQSTPVGLAELQKAKALLLRQIPLNESGVDNIAQELLGNADLGVPLDQQRISAQRYIDLTPQNVQVAFQNWMRPGDLVRTSQGPAP